MGRGTPCHGKSIIDNHLRQSHPCNRTRRIPLFMVVFWLDQRGQADIIKRFALPARCGGKGCFVALSPPAANIISYPHACRAALIAHPRTGRAPEKNDSNSRFGIGAKKPTSKSKSDYGRFLSCRRVNTFASVGCRLIRRAHYVARISVWAERSYRHSVSGIKSPNHKLQGDFDHFTQTVTYQ